MDEQIPRRATINPFLAAKKSSDVMAVIDERDVRAYRSDWTAEQANEFLRLNARTIATAMLASGLAAVSHLLEESHDN